MLTRYKRVVHKRYEHTKLVNGEGQYLPEREANAVQVTDIYDVYNQTVDPDCPRGMLNRFTRVSNGFRQAN